MITSLNKKTALDEVAKKIAETKGGPFGLGLNPVPGEGNPDAKVIFIGEAPGFNEDQKGIPFCGAAGLLLDDLLASIGLKRSDVWIGNVIKCRPPENREPMVDEIRSCSPYLEMQIKALKPKLIITLGRYAMDHFVKGLQISKDHGTPKRVGDWVILPLYHPAAALRSTGVMTILKKDFRKIPEILKKDPKEIELVNSVKVSENQISLL